MTFRASNRTSGGWRITILVLTGILAAGCSSTGGDAPVAEGTQAPSGNKLANLFVFNTTTPETKAGPKEDMFCPPVSVQPGTAAFTVYDRGREGDPLGVRYQASFGQLVRECVDLGAEVGVRIGVSGRAVAGPLGGTAGQTLDVPVRFVVLDGDERPIFSEVTRIQVTIPPGQTGISFTHVEEVGSFPMPPDRLKSWEFRIGFETKPPGRPQG